MPTLPLERRLSFAETSRGHLYLRNPPSIIDYYLKPILSEPSNLALLFCQEPIHITIPRRLLLLKTSRRVY